MIYFLFSIIHNQYHSIILPGGKLTKRTLHFVAGEHDKSMLLNECLDLVDANRLLEMEADEVLYLKRVVDEGASKVNAYKDNIVDGVYRVHPGLDAFSMFGGTSLPYLDVIANSKQDAIDRAAYIIPELNSANSVNQVSSVEYLYKH